MPLFGDLTIYECNKIAINIYFSKAKSLLSFRLKILLFFESINKKRIEHKHVNNTICFKNCVTLFSIDILTFEFYNLKMGMPNKNLLMTEVFYDDRIWRTRLGNGLGLDFRPYSSCFFYLDYCQGSESIQIQMINRQSRKDDINRIEHGHNLSDYVL